MRRGPATAATIAAAFLVASATGSAAPRKPALHVAFADGVTISGVRFASRERVTVTFRSGQLWHRTLTATRTGRFAMTFPAAHVDRCQGYVAIAHGASGDTAVDKVMPLACAPE